MNIHIEIGPGPYADLEAVAPGESPCEQIHIALDERDKLLKLCDEAQEALDVLAGDIEDTFPARGQAAADLAMRLRAALPAAPLGVPGTPAATATPNRAR